MGSFYTVPSSLRITFSLLALAAYLVQTTSCLFLLARSGGRGRYFSLIYELTLSVYLATAAFLLVSFQDQTLQGGAALTAHAAIRWAGALTAFIGIAMFFNPAYRRFSNILTVIFVALSLPCFDGPLGRGFAFIFMAGVLFFLVRASDGLLNNIRHLKGNLSRLSVKEAVDTLHGGILFSTAGGRVVLQNSGMLALVRSIFGMPVPNPTELWRMLQTHQGVLAMPDAKLGVKLLIRLPDTAFEFSRETIAIGYRTYSLICAVDVTEADRITRELNTVTDELGRTAGRLQYVLDHYEEIKSAREAVELKRRIHDMMGQRISVLNRALQSPPTDVQILTDITPLLSDLMRDIRESRADCPSEVLGHMQRTFDLAGVGLPLTVPCPRTTAGRCCS